jgi:hypothetical protein
MPVHDTAFGYLVPSSGLFNYYSTLLSYLFHLGYRGVFSSTGQIFKVQNLVCQAGAIILPVHWTVGFIAVRDVGKNREEASLIRHPIPIRSNYFS